MSISKRKRVSKKNKASWRKHVDINDVEEFLEDQRLEERIGKASVKQNDELFTVDTVGNARNLLSSKERRKLNARKPSRALAILENTSKVQDPLVQRDRIKQKQNGRNLLAEITGEKVSQRTVQANKDRLKYIQKYKKSKKIKNVKTFTNDIWDAPDKFDQHKEYKNDWITRNLALHHLKNTGKIVVYTPDSARLKTTSAKALELPHPGMSYNPSLKDHQNLIQQVIDKESKIIKEEKHLKRVTTEKFSKVTPEERDMSQLKELASGLPTEDDENVEEMEEQENEDDAEVYTSVNPPVQNKKKDRKARRKQREQRELLKQKQKVKLEKKKITDIHRLKVVTAEVLKEEDETNEMKNRRKITLQKKKFEPRRLAKIKYSEPEVPLNMAEDLAGNLRNVKPECNLLIDRFKSLQKRNILPPSVDGGIRKKSKVKRYVRNTHKPPPPAVSRKK